MILHVCCVYRMSNNVVRVRAGVFAIVRHSKTKGHVID